MDTIEMKRFEKPSQIISLPFLAGEGWLHFFPTAEHTSSVLRKAAKEKTAISTKSAVKKMKALVVV